MVLVVMWWIQFVVAVMWWCWRLHRVVADEWWCWVLVSWCWDSLFSLYRWERVLGVDGT